MLLELLSDYSFWTVALGTTLFALATSVVGTVSVLTKQSLIGDCLGHAAYPGIIFAFMVFQTRQPLVLMLGAIFSGYVSYGLVHVIRRYSQQSLINCLTLVSASFFGFGMVLKQLIQGHPAFANSSQAGLQTYLFGQAAFIQLDDVYLILLVSGIALLFFAICYQSFKLYLFDDIFANSVGVSTVLLKQVTMLLMISLISVGLKVVGTVLISSFLIAPASIGLLWSRRYQQTLWISAITAMLSAFLGTLLSSIVSGLSTGPMIIVIMSLMVFISFVLTQKGGRRV